MKVITDQSLLHAGLQMAYRAIAGGTAHPILTGVLLTAQEGILHLSATDLEKSIEAVVPAAVEMPGSLVLPGREFSEIVGRIPGGDIQISAPEDRHQAVVTWRASEFVLNGYPPDQFPSLPTADGSRGYTVPAADLGRSLSNTVFAASTDDAMPVISGVRLKVGEGKIQATATDGYRIAVSEIEAPSAGGEVMEVALPRKSIGDLVRVLSSASADDEATLALSENHVFFELPGGVKFSTVILEGQYPDVLSMVPAPGDYGTEARFDRGEFSGATSRTALLAEDHRGARPIQLHLKEDRLILKASSAELGEAYDEIDAEVMGPNVDILFQAKYLIEGIRNISRDRVVFNLDDAESAARLQGEDDPEFYYVVLPMKPRT